MNLCDEEQKPEPCIAVVIAAYNAEKYIERCIQSVQKQIYKNWRIYIVDDGSTDNTANIIKSMARQENRIHAVHTANHGVFSARKSAIESVQDCEYLTFLDSDDFFCDNSLIQRCIDEMTKNRFDYVGFNFRNGNRCGFSAREKIQWTNKKDLIKDLLVGMCIDGNMPYSFYKTENVKKYFKVYTYNNDDFLNKYEILVHSERCAFIPVVGYYYYPNPESQTHSLIREKDILYYEHATEFTKKVQERFPDLERECEYFCNNILLWLATQLSIEKAAKKLKIYNPIMKELKCHTGIFIDNPYFGKRKKIRFLLIRVHMYRILFCIYSVYKRIDRR